MHGTARALAVRAATTGPDAVGGNVKQVGAVRRDRLDATARHGTKVVHALFYGRRLPLSPNVGAKPLQFTQSAGEEREKRPAPAAHHLGMKMGLRWNVRTGRTDIEVGGCVEAGFG